MLSDVDAVAVALSAPTMLSLQCGNGNLAQRQCCSSPTDLRERRATGAQAVIGGREGFGMQDGVEVEVEAGCWVLEGG